MECTSTTSLSRTNASNCSSYGRTESLPDAVPVNTRSTSTPSSTYPTPYLHPSPTPEPPAWSLGVNSEDVQKARSKALT